MKPFIFAVSLIVGLVAVTSAFAAPQPCSDKMSIDAERTASSITTWNGLYTYFKKYGYCDNGGVAESIDEAANVLFVRKWSGLASIRTHINSEPEFGTFLIRHINEMWSVDDLKAVKAKAVNQCPSELTAFCSDIEAAANRATRQD